MKGADDMPQNRFMKNPKTALFLFLAGTLSIMVFGFEKYLGWRYPEVNPAERKGLVRHIRLGEAQPLTVRKWVPTDDYLKEADGLEKKEFRLEVDADGFIYPSRVHENPDLKIFFLGGSTTACAYVEEQNRFPYLAGRLLEKEGRKVNSFNGGHSANNTLHLIDVLVNKIIPFEPDIVVMMENINDISILMHEGDYWNNNPTRSPIYHEPESPPFVRILRDSKELLVPNIYRRVKPLIMNVDHDEFAAVRGKKLKIDEEYFVKKFRTNLQTFINICRANGIVPVLMTQASRFKDKPDEIVAKYPEFLERSGGVTYSQLKGMFDKFNDVIRKTGAANNVLVIDLAARVPQEKEYIYDYDHYNDNGSKFVARIIADELEKIIAAKEKLALAPPLY